MIIKEFFEKYNGKEIDYDGYYDAQCVDLYDMYCKEVVGCPIYLVEGAKDIWNNYPLDYFDRVPNTIDAIPNEGDVMIWGSGLGPYGHVAIYSSGDVNNFVSFDQNFPLGTPCHFQDHNYNYVIGWLRPKKQSDALTECLRMHAELVTELEIVKKQLTEKDILISSQANELLLVNSRLNEALSSTQLLEEELQKKEELRAKWYKLYQHTIENLNTCKTDSAFFQKRLTECQAKLDFTFWELLVKLWEKIKAHKFTGT